MGRLYRALVFALLSVVSISALAPRAPAHAEAALPSVNMLSGNVQVGGTGTVSGSGFTPNNWVYVYYRRPDGTTNTAFIQTNASGTFSFTLGFSAVHGTGLEFVLAYDYGTAHWTPVVTIAVTSGVPVSVRSLALSANQVPVGNTITVSGTSFSPGNWVYVFFQRPNGTTGAFWAQADGTGAFSSLLGFNGANGCGAESIWAYDYGTQLWSNPESVAVTGCSAGATGSAAQVSGSPLS